MYGFDAHNRTKCGSEIQPNPHLVATLNHTWNKLGHPSINGQYCLVAVMSFFKKKNKSKKKLWTADLFPVCPELMLPNDDRNATKFQILLSSSILLLFNVYSTRNDRH